MPIYDIFNYILLILIVVLFINLICKIFADHTPKINTFDASLSPLTTSPIKIEQLDEPSSELVDDYIRNSLLENANICSATVDREDQDIYRDGFFGFRNQINQSSNTVDLVDKINDMYLSGSTDISQNYKDVPIKDVFDDLTKSADIHNQQCVKLPEFDTVTKQGHYKSGQTYTRDNWMYAQEKVGNGGKFFDQIYPDDPMATSQMIYTS
jgi:hypothetical protein